MNPRWRRREFGRPGLVGFGVLERAKNRMMGRKSKQQFIRRAVRDRAPWGVQRRGSKSIAGRVDAVVLAGGLRAVVEDALAQMGCRNERNRTSTRTMPWLRSSSRSMRLGRISHQLGQPQPASNWPRSNSTWPQPMQR